MLLSPFPYLIGMSSDLLPKVPNSHLLTTQILNLTAPTQTTLLRSLPYPSEFSTLQSLLSPLLPTQPRTPTQWASLLSTHPLLWWRESKYVYVIVKGLLMRALEGLIRPVLEGLDDGRGGSDRDRVRDRIGKEDKGYREWVDVLLDSQAFCEWSSGVREGKSAGLEVSKQDVLWVFELKYEGQLKVTEADKELKELDQEDFFSIIYL